MKNCYDPQHKKIYYTNYIVLISHLSRPPYIAKNSICARHEQKTNTAELHSNIISKLQTEDLHSDNMTQPRKLFHENV